MVPSTQQLKVQARGPVLSTFQSWKKLGFQEQHETQMGNKVIKWTQAKVLCSSLVERKTLLLVGRGTFAPTI